MRRATRVSEALTLIMNAFSFSSRSTRNGEKHGGGRGRGSLQREGEKDSQTSDYILQPPAAGAEPQISADAVSGAAGESRTGRVSGTHTNPGEDASYVNIYLRIYLTDSGRKII